MRTLDIVRVAVCLLLPVTAFRVFGEDFRFGEDDLELVFSERTGWPIEYRCSGQSRLIAGKFRGSEFRVRYLPADGKGRELTSGRLRSGGFEKVSNGVLVSHMLSDGWAVDATWRLRPEERRIEASFAVTRRGPRVRMLHAAVEMGAMPFGNAQARVVLPMTWPRAEATAATGAFSFRQRESPYPVIADDGSGRSVTWLVNDLTEYADLGLTVVSDFNSCGADVMQYYYCAGFMDDGDCQVLGDAHLIFGDEGIDGALARISHWHDSLGRRTVPDRPEWIKKAVFYSIHPLGTRKGGRKDGRGIQGVIDYLDAMKALGCNLLWVQPLLYNSAYNPSDYYRLQDGIGTEDDVARLSAEAHRRGLRVWHDMIPHGGDTNSVRYLRHPEWYAVQANGSPAAYWACDFNHPGWCGYMANVVEYWSRRANLDGHRVDAAYGARYENWNPSIPYGRASFARLQGGMRMQKAIRDAARRVCSDAAIFPEARTDPFATVSDVLWDFPLGCEILRGLRGEPAETFVPRLRRWLQDAKQCAIPGTIFYRYAENHDLLRCVDLYGGSAAIALSALTSLIDGFTGIVDGMEAMNFEDYQRIFALRARIHGLNNGTVDYLSPKTSPGVFACTRREGSDTSVLYVNLNSSAADGLEPFEFALINNGERVRPVLPSVCVPISDRVGADPSVVQVTTNGTVVSTVVKIPGVRNWFASTAEGVFSAPLFPPHGSREPTKSFIYRLPQGGGVVFDGRIHPFGVSRDYALLGGDDGKRTIVGEVSEGVGVRLLDSFRGTTGLFAEITSERGCGVPVRWRILPTTVAKIRAHIGSGTGDGRLKRSVGGYAFEDESLKVCFLRNGALCGAWRKRGDKLEQIADKGWFAVNGVNRSVGHVGQVMVYDQASDAESFATLRHGCGGELIAEFRGELRNLSREGKMPFGTAYHTVYVLGGTLPRMETTFRCHAHGTADETHFETGRLAPDSAHLEFIGDEPNAFTWKGIVSRPRGLQIRF